MCVTLNNTLISHWIKILRAFHAFLPIEIVLMLMNVWILANILYDEYSIIFPKFLYNINGMFGQSMLVWRTSL